MRVLLVNDDGIDAIGIKILEEALQKYGEVVVVAPEKGMSAYSHTIQIHTPIRLEERSKNHYAISSTPADCVRLGVDLFGPFDYVFSGINNGLNLGTDVIYSGTVNAAIEGAILKTKSVAISTDFDCFDIVRDEIDSVIDYLFSNDLFSDVATINVNFPTSDFKKSQGIKIARQGVKDFKTFFVKTDLGYVAGKEEITYDTNCDSDVYLASIGYITITVIDKLQNHDDEYQRLLKKVK